MAEKSVIMHAIVHGNVQGVFFRATVSSHAKALNLQGTAKNLPDGTVEVWAKGTQKDLDELIEKMKKDPGMGSVSHIDIEYPDEEKKFDGFSVSY